MIRTTRTPDGYALALENATVAHALDIYCKDFGKAPLIDPECPNLERVRITLKSPEGKTLTRAESLAAIRTALEMNGLYLENYGDDFILVLPRKNACKRGIPIIMDLDAARLGNGMNLVSVMIPFENISAEDAQKVLEGSKSSEGQLVVFAHTNRILVTDAERNVKRMLELAKAIDVAAPATEQSFVRQIKNASATDIKAVLDQLVRGSQKSQTAQNGRLSPMPAPLARGRNPRSPQSTADNASILFDISDADRGIIRGRVTIAAEEHANKLVIVASKANMDFFDKVIETLDVDTTPEMVVRVYLLRYAPAENVCRMMNELIGNSTDTNQTSRSVLCSDLPSNRAAAKKLANQRSGDAKVGALSKDNTTIVADKRINGIVVKTRKEFVPTIESIIRSSMDIKQTDLGFYEDGGRKD